MLLSQQIIIIFLFTVSSGATVNLIIPNSTCHSDMSDILPCIVAVVKNSYLYKPTISLFDVNKSKNASYNCVTTNIMKLLADNLIPIILKPIDAYTNENNDGNLISIIYFEDCSTLIDFNNYDIDRHNKYMIILNDQVLSNCKDRLIETATTVAEYDVLFIYKDEDHEALSTIKFSTCIPLLDSETCKININIYLSTVWSCENGLIEEGNINVFPNKKPTNWMKCPLNVGMGSLYPFVKSYNQTLRNQDPLDMVDGSDVEIMKIVANYFNASLKLYHIKIDPENIFIDLSFMPFILNGSLEVCAGGLYRLFGDSVSYSGIYSKEAVIWIYTVERDNKSWSTFVKNSHSFYIFIMFYLYYSIIGHIFLKFDGYAPSFGNNLFYNWGALVGTASLEGARTLKQMALNLFYLVLCLHFTAYVSIQMYSSLTIQRPPHTYDDIDDLSESGRLLYLKNNAKYFVEDDKYLTFANTSGSCSDFGDCVTKILESKGITVIIDGLLPEVQTKTAVSDEAKILKARKPILFVYHEMLIRKESSLVGSLEKVIERLFEVGICQKLYEESIGTLLLDKARYVNQNMLMNSYSCEVGCKITFSQCAGIFYVWILGCIISSFVFSFEILINKAS